MAIDKSNEPMIGEFTENSLLEKAQDLVAKRTETWEIAAGRDAEEAENRIPKFEQSEIEVGNIMGKGGFFQVSEVKSIRLIDDNETSELDILGIENEDELYIQGVVQDRKFMQQHCLRNGTDCRYAIKSMLSICKGDPSMFVNASVDLAIEAKFLSVVRHPNIIKMRARSAGNLCSPKSFLILDRLYDTLTERILQWEMKRDSFMFKLFDFQGKKEKAFLAERLSVAYDIASALSYLHERNIIYRDLKPNNIGFDVRGDAKLFDFGLATEFDEAKLKLGTFRLTGDTGTIRYMAPEVALSQPYTCTADVYSYGILVWHMLALQLPYANSTDDAVERMVVHAGYRPKIDDQWPQAIQACLKSCFASSRRRPQMLSITETMRKEIKELGGEKYEDMQDSSRSEMTARHYE